MGIFNFKYKETMNSETIDSRATPTCFVEGCVDFLIKNGSENQTIEHPDPKNYVSRFHY